MGEADDVPPQSHREVSPTFEAELGRAGPIADQAHQHAPVAEAFDEDAWFEQEAARLRQLNESKAQEVRTWCNVRLVQVTREAARVKQCACPAPPFTRAKVAAASEPISLKRAHCRARSKFSDWRHCQQRLRAYSSCSSCSSFSTLAQCCTASPRKPDSSQSTRWTTSSAFLLR
jgi:hypothetical protein